MAGGFAKRVRAQHLILNHIGGRFPSPRIGDTRSGANRIIADLEYQATKAWDPPQGIEAIVALDFMRISVPNPELDSKSFQPVLASSPDVNVTTMQPASNPPTGIPNVFSPQFMQGSSRSGGGRPKPQHGDYGHEMAYDAMQGAYYRIQAKVGEVPAGGLGGLEEVVLESTSAQRTFNSQRTNKSDGESRRSKKRKRHHDNYNERRR